MNNQLIFVEGLWHTGKSFFVSEVNKRKIYDDKVTVIDNLRDLGTVRHGAYIIYPNLIRNTNQIYDRSPVTMKVIADQNLGLYQDKLISSAYWLEYYNDWLKMLQASDYKISFIYFRPFEKSRNRLQKSILNYVKAYNKTQLLIDSNRVTKESLLKIHEMFTTEINSLYQILKPRFTFYQVEYQDTEEALDILRYEKFMPSLGAYNDDN